MISSIIVALRFVIEFPIRFLLIAIDFRLKHNPFCRVPRSFRELSQNPNWLFQNIFRRRSPGDAISVQVLSVTGLSEPSKARTIEFFRVVRISGKTPETLDICVKLPSGRNIATWIRAIMATFARPTENDFYEYIIPFLQTRAPSFVELCPVPLAVQWDRTFNRSIIVTRVIDRKAYISIPDHGKVTEGHIRVMHGAVVKLHAVTWQLNKDPRKFPHMTTRTGLGFIDGGLRLFWGQIALPQRALWTALCTHFDKRPVVISHGDFRPGNMLFRADNGPLTDFKITDWEACNFTTFLWDCSYSIGGLPARERRARAQVILDGYLSALEAEKVTLPCSRAELWIDLQLLWVVVAYFGYLLSLVGGVGANHGNTEEDCNAWLSRLILACLDATADVHAVASLLNVSVPDLVACRAEWEKDLPKTNPDL